MRTFLMVVLTLCLAACGQGGGASYPKPRAFSRPEIYPAQYDTLEIGAFRLPVNRHAAKDIPAPGQLTAAYPAYGANVFFTAVEGSPRVIMEHTDARLERLALNAGASPTTRSFAVAGPFQVWLAVADDPVAPVPYQLLAVDTAATRLLWVSAAWSGAPASADSIGPVFRALGDDFRALTNALAND